MLLGSGLDVPGSLSLSKELKIRSHIELEEHQDDFVLSKAIVQIIKGYTLRLTVGDMNEDT